MKLVRFVFNWIQLANKYFMIVFLTCICTDLIFFNSKYGATHYTTV